MERHRLDLRLKCVSEYAEKIHEHISFSLRRSFPSKMSSAFSASSCFRSRRSTHTPLAPASNQIVHQIRIWWFCRRYERHWIHRHCLDGLTWPSFVVVCLFNGYPLPFLKLKPTTCSRNPKKREARKKERRRRRWRREDWNRRNGETEGSAQHQLGSVENLTIHGQRMSVRSLSQSRGLQ